MIFDLPTLLAAAAPFLADAAAPAPTPGLFNNPIVPIALMFAVVYFMLIRPNQTRQKAVDALQTSLKTGDKVVTSSGIHGMIANVKEGKTLMLKIADNVKIEIDKSAIATVEKSSEQSTPAPVAISSPS